MTSSSFTKKIVVDEKDIDDLGHVNNVVYVQWVQDIAAAHWDKIAPAGFQEKFMWVVLKHVIEYRKPAFCGEEILASTWIETIDSVRSDRCLEILNSSTKSLLCKARTTWCLVDRATGRPKKIEGEVKVSLTGK